MKVRPFIADDAEIWDSFCVEAPMATFLHSRRFLSYHGDRFRDLSVMVTDDHGRLAGLMPAAEGPSPGLVVSHPGATFGGLLHRGGLLGESMVDAIASVCRHFADAGYQRLRYKAVPRIYHQRPADDDSYALFRLGALRSRCDLSSTIDLVQRGPVGERRRRGSRKALRAGVTAALDDRGLTEFWSVLSANLAERHQVRPVHTLAEIQLLQTRFPDNIRLITARQDAILLAGTLLFCTPTAVHAQYIAASDDGRNCGALDAVFEYAIGWAASCNARYFDFGISNEDEGRILNSGLHEFKSEFGASGTIHEFFDIDLTRSLPCP